MNGGKALLIMFGVMFMIIVMPFLINGIHDARTDTFEESFASTTTAAGVVSANVSLSYNLFADAAANVNSVSSNITSDSPSASTYNTVGDILLVTGLTASQTRTLTVNYDIASVTLAELPNLDPLLLAMTYWWVLAIMGLIGGAAWLAMKN